jgi:hypothetical protein
VNRVARNWSAGKGAVLGGLTALALVVVAYALVASRLDRWWITGPMVFVAAGVVLGPGGWMSCPCR